MTLNLREFTLEDLKPLYEIFCDEIILNNLGIGKTAREFTLEDERQWLEKVVRSYDDPNSKEYHLAIEINGELAGSICLFNYKEGVGECGIWLGREFWNSGKIIKIINLFKERIIRRYSDLEKVVVNIDPKNTVAQRLAEYLGFKKTQSLRGGDVSYELFRKNVME